MTSEKESRSARRERIATALAAAMLQRDGTIDAGEAVAKADDLLDWLDEAEVRDARAVGEGLKALGQQLAGGARVTPEET